jgi:hypothetical protein
VLLLLLLLLVLLVGESESYRDGTSSVSGSVSLSVQSSGRSDSSAKPAMLGQQLATANYLCP